MSDGFGYDDDGGSVGGVSGGGSAGGVGSFGSANESGNPYGSGSELELEPRSKPAVWALIALSAAFGLIGLASGFATVLGVTATAAGGVDTSGYGPMLITAVSSLVLGVLLVSGGVLLWRARRSAVMVISSAITLLALSSLARMALDSVTFISVIGTVLSLLALIVMGYLLTSEDVRKHVAEGVPLRLR